LALSRFALGRFLLSYRRCTCGGRGRRLRGRRVRARSRLDRLALRVGLRLREEFRTLLVHDDVAALDGLVIELFQRIRPGLAGAPATAGWIECFTIRECVRQFGIGAPGVRHGLRYVFAWIAMAVEDR